MLVIKGKRGESSIWECDVCLKHFPVTNSEAGTAFRNGKKKTCGAECLSVWRKKEGCKNVLNWTEKNVHPRLRSGSGVTTDGYVWVYAPDRGYFHNQIKLHRYLMEIKLGRRLTSDEIVHHKDENKFNNNIDNLEIHTRASHNREHGTLRRMAREKAWSREEIEDLYKLTRSEFCEKHRRTRGACAAMRYRRSSKKVL